MQKNKKFLGIVFVIVGISVCLYIGAMWFIDAEKTYMQIYKEYWALILTGLFFIMSGMWIGDSK